MHSDDYLLFWVPWGFRLTGFGATSGFLGFFLLDCSLMLLDATGEFVCLVGFIALVKLYVKL